MNSLDRARQNNIFEKERKNKKSEDLVEIKMLAYGTAPENDDVGELVKRTKACERRENPRYISCLVGFAVRGIYAECIYVSTNSIVSFKALFVGYICNCRMANKAIM